MVDQKLFREIPLPSHYNPGRAGEVWRVPYQERAEEARLWAHQHQLNPASDDPYKIMLFAVDVQNTFCIPGFELFVGGRSGNGAVDDNRRLSEFIYRNLGSITSFTMTMDTHLAMQIFHPILLVDKQGQHPAPYTLVTYEDVRSGKWIFNPDLAGLTGVNTDYWQRHLLHYTKTLKEQGKYDLTIWPYHAMLGGIGHALVSAVEEAVFFHSIARTSQPNLEIKGKNPLTEHYSVIGPEVLTGPDGAPIGQKEGKFVQRLAEVDAMIVAGQAKSHCVAWTIADLLEEIKAKDPSLARKVYLLEDCTSPVVIHGAIDYSEQADAAYRSFAEAGMHLVRSTDPIESWPGIGRKQSLNSDR